MAAKKAKKSASAASKKSAKGVANGGASKKSTPDQDKALIESLGLPAGTVIVKRGFTERLAVPVSEKEKDALSAELSDVILKRLACDEEQAQKNSDYRKKRHAFDEREKELAHAVHDNEKFEAVECVTALLATNEVRLMRLDTRKQTGESRTATQEELREAAAQQQPPLFEEPEDGGAGGKGALATVPTAPVSGPVLTGGAPPAAGPGEQPIQ